jgi:hypothetical protein
MVHDADGAAAATVPHLFVILRAHDPQAAPARLSLRGRYELSVGRGDALALDGRQLRVDDPWMSNLHARLVHGADGWELHDAGSKNGTWMNGARVERAAIADGDILEIGQTFMAIGPALGEGLRGPDEPVPGLPTLRTDLGAEVARVAAVASSAVSLVVGGESGTGKEVLARGLHASRMAFVVRGAAARQTRASTPSTSSIAMYGPSSCAPTS